MGLKTKVILVFLFLGALYVCFYISIGSDRIRNIQNTRYQNPPNARAATAVDKKEATAVDQRTPIAYESGEATVRDGRVGNDKRKSNTMEVNIHLGVNMSEISKVVTEIMSQLERMLVQRKAMVNSEGTVGAKTDINENGIRTKDLTEPKTILTLFTTWKNVEGTRHIHEHTITNWASFKPAVNVILFTDDVSNAKECINLGWKVLDIPKKAENGIPILKNMFIQAMKISDSYFYGYANSDILFTDGLLNTLLTMTYKMRDMSVSKPILLTGNRWNVANVTKDEIVPRKNIETIIKQRGSFFMTSAEEYFITSYNYPWAEIPDLVIGIVAYDNWLVLNARLNGHFTIDTSKTVIAMHQDIDNSYYRSHFRTETAYNEKLLKSIYKIEIPYEKGYSNCIEMYTEFINDIIVIKNRKVEDYCNA